MHEETVVLLHTDNSYTLVSRRNLVVVPCWDGSPLLHFFSDDDISSCTYTFPLFHFLFEIKKILIMRRFPKALGSSTPLAEELSTCRGCPKAALQARSATILHFSCYGIFFLFYLFTYYTPLLNATQVERGPVGFIDLGTALGLTGKSWGVG